MPLNKLNTILKQVVKTLHQQGNAKDEELVITGIESSDGFLGVRYFVEGFGKQAFLKMNSNSYLGLHLNPKVISAEEVATREFGVGPGAVRFISGTYQPHKELENRLAKFHDKESGMIFSSAYVTSMGVLMPLSTKETVFISDELNHNCIIQAMRLARPIGKSIYKHNDMDDLQSKLQYWSGKAKRALVITDGIFSMRGDNAPLKDFSELCVKFNDQFEEGVISIIDDSHGVAAFGATGRGTEEYCDTKVDIIIGTLGKGFGVNGGYVVASQAVTEFLRQTAPMYIYSNPITVGETAAAIEAVKIVDSKEGTKLLQHLRKMTKYFENGLITNCFETIVSEHPVVPLMVRDTKKTAALVKHLLRNGVLATGLNFPVVPKGDEEIRFQVNANHTQADIDYVIDVLKNYKH